MPKLLIVSGSPKTADLYRTCMEQRGACCKVAQNVTEMFEILLRTPTNGLALDVPTIIRATEKEKSLLQDLSDYYPILRMRWDAKTGRVRGLVLGRALNSDDPVIDFLDKFCRNRPARICRKNKRYPVPLNALLSPTPDFTNELVEKVFTVDISEGGCFLFSSRNWSMGQTAWVRLVGLADATPIPIEIRRWVPWGEGLCIPGIGACFKALTSRQLAELRTYLGRRPVQDSPRSAT